MRKLLFIGIVVLSMMLSSCLPTKADDSKDTDMIFVSGGTFIMGSDRSYANLSEKPIHPVTVSSFYICRHEVTQQEYLQTMGYNQSYDQAPDKPVETVSWYNAMRYCNKLSILEGLTPVYTLAGYGSNPLNWPGNGPLMDNIVSMDIDAEGYRLPTEAEWEYAARGGQYTHGYEYSGSSDLASVSWYASNWGYSHPVMTLNPNELGIYDMSGNVWEWCWDWFDAYNSDPVTDPAGPSTGDFRVMRGGSWWSEWRQNTVSYRSTAVPLYYNIHLGFRVARSRML